jgi:hypothetical protein
MPKKNSALCRIEQSSDATLCGIPVVQRLYNKFFCNSNLCKSVWNPSQNFLVDDIREYLCEIETKFENILVWLSGTNLGLIGIKNESRKSRESAHLKATILHKGSSWCKTGFSDFQDSAQNTCKWARVVRWSAVDSSCAYCYGTHGVRPFLVAGVSLRSVDCDMRF